MRNAGAPESQRCHAVRGSGATGTVKAALAGVGMDVGASLWRNDITIAAPRLIGVISAQIPGI